jgi:membrane-associated protease RseP (regulator of RpoE activity)
LSQHTPSAEIPEFQSERSNAPLDPDFDPAGGVGGTAADGDAVPDGTNDAEPMDPDWFGRSGEPGFRAEIGKPYVAVMPALGLLAGIVAMLVFGGTSTLILVASIVFIIFMHELGHYVMARRSGMKVTEFMIGFGPRIASFRRGDVEFGLKAIPAGAYVKIIGMVSNEEVAPGDEDKTYRVKGFWARLGVAVAGSTMHFLMALILLFIALTNSGIQDERDWLIREVVAGSTADQMGMKAGDRLISLNDTRTETFSDMVDVARASGGKMVTATFERDGTTMTGTARTAQRLNIFGTIGEDLVLFETTDGRLATSLLQGGRIAGAGLQDGDVVTAIDGKPLTSIDEVGTLLSEPRYESQGPCACPCFPRDPTRIRRSKSTLAGAWLRAIREVSSVSVRR